MSELKWKKKPSRPGYYWIIRHEQYPNGRDPRYVDGSIAEIVWLQSRGKCRSKFVSFDTGVETDSPVITIESRDVVLFWAGPLAKKGTR